MANETKSDLYEVRNSPIHGSGVFALKLIPKGTRFLEYTGEHISHAAADALHQDKNEDDNHTFLFVLDKRTVINAGVGGNAARFVNHSCDPNCETVIESRRVFIESIRDIEPGEELYYDYQIMRDDTDPADIDAVFACRCGAANCRGTMLEPRKEKKVKPKKQAVKAKSKAKVKTKVKVKAKAKAKSKAKVKTKTKGASKGKSKSKVKVKPKAKAKTRPKAKTRKKAGRRR